MKVVLVNTFIGCDSTGNLTYSIYNKLQENKIETVVAFGRQNSKMKDHVYKIGNKIDYLAHAMLTRVTDRNGLYSKHATKEFLKFLDEYKPDIIHLHNLHGYYINIVMLMEYISKKNIAVVWTLHDCWAFTGHCPYYTDIDCSKWISCCFSCPKKKEHPASYLLDRSKQNYAIKKEFFNKPQRMILTPVSDWLSTEVKKSFLGKQKIETVYNGIDLNIFKIKKSKFKSKYKIAKEKILLLGVAIHWVPSKGLEDIIQLSKVLSETKYKIVVIGLDKNQIQYVTRKAPNILALPKTDNADQLADAYNAADVFINPSQQETFGMVTAEALSCGTPAVVYNATASPELVDENTGRVVEVGDIQAFAKAIDEILLIPDVSKNCRRRAELLFDRNQNLEKYIKIYERLVETE